MFGNHCVKTYCQTLKTIAFVVLRVGVLRDREGRGDESRREGLDGGLWRWSGGAGEHRHNCSEEHKREERHMKSITHRSTRAVGAGSGGQGSA